MVMTDDRVRDEAPPVDGPMSARYRSRSAGERREAFEQLSALVSSVHAELCALAVAADAEGDAALDGLSSAAWIAFHGGLTSRHAREVLRVGAALDELP